MKDFNGSALIIGDSVAYLPPNYRHLVKGTVVGFTPKGVVIERYNSPEEIQKYENHYNRKYIPTIDRRETGYVARIQDYE